MSGMCDGRVCVVTGAGRGIGREHALMLASEGASVVVNDLGGDIHGSGADAGPAQEVVEEIRAAGGTAVANGDDVSSWDGAHNLINTAIESFGRVDVLINNAGILRDRMLTTMSEDEWDTAVRVNLKGTFCPARAAAAHWRERSKTGETLDARMINTTSGSGIYGNAGQTNYGAAKAGVAAFTFIASLELARYGVTVNAIAPGAATRLTMSVPGIKLDEEAIEKMSPRWIAPVATWLASVQSAGVTGRVFDVSSRSLAVAEGWHRGPTARPVEDPAQVDEVVRKLLADARNPAGISGDDRDEW